MADWSKQRYFEDVNVGDEVPPVVFNLPIQRMVMLAGANRDFFPVHHNTPLALKSGAPEMFLNNVSVQGMWERCVTEYVGLRGRVRKVGPFRINIMNTTGESVVTKGTVERKYQENGQNFVELKIWSEHSKGVSVGPGPVLVTLPSRS